jgi:hypothetical protein
MNPTLQKLVVKKMVNEEMKKERRIWMDRCIQAVGACIAADLLDKWEWDPEQVKELLASVSSAFESIDDDFATLDDYIKAAKDKGVVI